MLAKNIPSLPDSLASWLNYTPYLVALTLCKLILASTAFFYNILTATQIVIIGLMYKALVCAAMATIAAYSYHRAKQNRSNAAKSTS